MLRVEKRDGRAEGLRATKLARSIHLALCASGAGGVERAIELAGDVMARLESASEGGWIASAEIATTVQQVLLASGHARVARAYGHVGRSRRRRQPLFGQLG